MKRLLTTILALTMAFALAVPAFAAPRGRGYTDGYVKLNDYDYSVRVEVRTTPEHAAYTLCSTAAFVRRVHSSITVTYITAHDGYIPRTGGYFDTINKAKNDSKSVEVPFGMSAEDYRGILGMGGSVTLHGDTNVTLKASVS